MTETPVEQEPASSTQPLARRSLRPYVAVGSLALAAAIALGFVWRRGSAQPEPRDICDALEQAGTVSDCRVRTGHAEHGVRVLQLARFRVSVQGRRAYTGTLARFDSARDLERYLGSAADAQRAAARKVASATEIGSESRTRAEDVLAELVPVQIRNDERLIAVHLVPIYGGPQPAAQGQVEAIRAAISR